MSQTVRVAFVIQKYPPFVGGAERQAALLAGLLNGRLDVCRVFTAQPDPQSQQGVPVRSLRVFAGSRWKHMRSFVSGFLHFLLHGREYSIVHGYAFSGLSCGAILGARLRGCKTVIKICSVGEQGDMSKLLRHPVGKRLWPRLLRSNTFVVPSPSLARDLLEEGIPREQIVVIPNAVSIRSVVASRAEMRRRIGLPEKPTVLFAARLVPEKGIEQLQRAWEMLNPDATLVLIGDGPQSSEISNWAAHRGNVRFFGATQDTEPYFAAADIFVAPSLSETFGNSLAEAMSYGLAAVTTPVGLARHWIRHEENGMIISNNSSSELTDALRRLIQDRALCEHLGAGARETVRSTFDPEAVTNRYQALYEELLGETSNARNSIMQSLWEY